MHCGESSYSPCHMFNLKLEPQIALLNIDMVAWFGYGVYVFAQF